MLIINPLEQANHEIAVDNPGCTALRSEGTANNYARRKALSMYYILASNRALLWTAGRHQKQGNEAGTLQSTMEEIFLNTGFTSLLLVQELELQSATQKPSCSLIKKNLHTGQYGNNY